MNIRPLPGMVLLCMDRAEEISNGIIIPEQAQERAQTGKVVKLGIWKPDNDGNLRAYDFKRGDKVLVNARRGRWLHEEKDRMKLVEAEDILAVL